MARVPIFAAVVALLALSSTPALAAPARVGVMPPKFEGEVSPEDQAALQQALLGALATEEIEVRPWPTRCEDAACVAEQAQAQDVARIVDTTIAFDTNDYRLTLAVLDPSGNTVRSLEMTCEICTVPDVEARFVSAAADLRDQLVASITTVRIDSDPPGASVSIDGQRLGVTPLESEIAAGPHQLRLEHEGYEVHEQAFEAAEGQRSSVELALTPATAAEPSPRGRRGLWLAGLGLIGGGAAAGIGGAVLIVLDSRPIERKCSGNDIDINGECRYLHDTITGGAVAAAVGGAALVTGIALAVVGRKGAKKAPREQARRLRVQPTMNGIGLWF